MALSSGSPSTAPVDPRKRQTLILATRPQLQGSKQRAARKPEHNHQPKPKPEPEPERERVPAEESDDFRAKDQPSGVMEAQCGRRSSTGFRNLRPCGPHITRGLSRVSPAVAGVSGRS